MIFMGRKIKRLNDEEAAFFFEQLGMILEAGIPVADGLEIFTEDSDDEDFKRVSLIITELMNEDMTLAEAMEKSETEYKRYKARTLSDVEKDYLDSIEDISATYGKKR